ncbi:hypothetical protein D1872_265670 [compost metagenome]
MMNRDEQVIAINSSEQSKLDQRTCAQVHTAMNSSGSILQLLRIALQCAKINDLQGIQDTFIDASCPSLVYRARFIRTEHGTQRIMVSHNLIHYRANSYFVEAFHAI